MRLNTGRTPSARRRLRHLVGGMPVSLPSRASEKPMRLEPAERAGGFRQALVADLGLGLDDAAHLRQEPRIDLAGGVDLLVGEAEPHRLRDLEHAVLRRRAERGADRVLVVALAEARDGDLVEAGEAGFQRAQRLLQAFLEGAADRHRLADRFHRGGQHLVGAGEFLEGEARNFRDHVVDGRLERGRRRAAGDVVGDLVERVADRELGRDLGDRKAGRLRGRAPTSATPAGSSR